MSGLGLILSGGGARGAYEVGVLEYVFNEFGDLTGLPPKVDLISGTSVGAVNGAFVASNIHDVPSGIRALVYGRNICAQPGSRYRQGIRLWSPSRTPA